MTVALDTAKITNIIELFESIRLERPKMLVGDEAPYSVGLRNWLNGFRTALTRLTPGAHELYYQTYNQILQLRGWTLNALGPEREMHAQGWTEEAIFDELLMIEIETWKRIRDQGS
jgi:hypothetical protein